MGRRQWEGWGEGRVKNYNGKMEVMVMTGVDDIETSQCPSPSLNIPQGEGLLSGSLVHTHPHTPSHTSHLTHLHTPSQPLPPLHRSHFLYSTPCCKTCRAFKTNRWARVCTCLEMSALQYGDMYCTVYIYQQFCIVQLSMYRI